MPSVGQLGGGRQHLGQDRAGGDQVDLRRVRRRARRWRRPAGSAPASTWRRSTASPSRAAGRLERRLVDRPGGEPEVVRAVLLGLGRGGRRRWRGRPAGRDPAERVAEQPVQRHAVRRLDQRHARAARARSTAVIVDWCAPPSGRERDAGRRAGDDEPRARVDGVDERVQPAQHERVVDRADRQQRLPGQVPRRARAGRAAGTGSSRRCRARCAGPVGPSAHFSTGSSLHDRRSSGANTPVAVDEAGQVRRGRRRRARSSRGTARPRRRGTGRRAPGRRPPGSRSACRTRMPVSCGTVTPSGPAPRGSARCSRALAAAHCPAGVGGSIRSHSVPAVEPDRRAQRVDLRRRSAAPSGCAGCRRSAGPSP